MMVSKYNFPFAELKKHDKANHKVLVRLHQHVKTRDNLLNLGIAERYVNAQHRAYCLMDSRFAW